MQAGGWLPAFIVPAAASPTTMPVGSRSAGDSHTARPRRSRRGEEPTPAVPNTARASGTPSKHQPHANPNSIRPRQRAHSVPRQARPQRSPDPTRTPTPSEAQPSPAPNPPQPLPRLRRGSSAGRCRCSPWSPGGTRSLSRGARGAASPGERHRAGTGRDGMSRPSWQAEKKKNN